MIRSTIRMVVNEALAALSGEFSALYARMGRPSIPPEKLLRAMLLQAFYSLRSERQLMGGWSSTFCSAGLSALALTMRCGITRRSLRTAIACWRATSPPSF
jgi:hypothetical protein